MTKRKSSGTTLLAARPRRPKQAKPAAPTPSLYAVHPGITMVQRWIDDLPAKTGRSLDEWLGHIRKSGPKDEKASREWLAATYQLAPNTAAWLAEKAFGGALSLAEETPAGYLK